VKIDARNFELSWYNNPPPTHTHTLTNPQTGQITTHCAAKLSAQCKISRPWNPGQGSIKVKWFNSIESAWFPI